MIEIMDGSAGSVLAIRATARLSAADYRAVLSPRISLVCNRFGMLRVLFLMDEDFQGWTWGAAWANTVLDVKHRRDLEKVAMIGAPKWEEWCIRAVASLLVTGELRTFRRDELAAAWRWIKS